MLNLDKYKIERGVKLKASQLNPNSYNPNKTTERIDEAIQESLYHYGQVLEILVRPDPKEKNKFIIIDGEHRFNYTDKEIYVNIIHDLSEDDAKKLTIVLNETRGKADIVELSTILADLENNLGKDLKVGLPFTDEELSNLLEIAEDTTQNQTENYDSNLEEQLTENIQDQIPNSQVKMVQLFLDTESYKIFDKYTEFLSEIYKSNNLTECVFEALRIEYENNNGN